MNDAAMSSEAMDRRLKLAGVESVCLWLPATLAPGVAYWRRDTPGSISAEDWKRAENANARDCSVASPALVVLLCSATTPGSA